MGSKLFKDINAIIDKETERIKTDVKDIKNNKKPEALQKVTEEASQKIEQQKDKINDVKKEAVDMVIEESKKVEDKIDNINIVSQIKKDFNSLKTSLEVNKLIDNQINEIVKEELEKVKDIYNQDDVENLFASAKTLYNKVLSSEQILTDMKDTYTEALTKKVKSTLDDSLGNVKNLLGENWDRKILSDSKIATVLTDYVKTEVNDVINAIINNKVVVGVSKNLVEAVTKIKDNAKKKLEAVVKPSLEYAKKLKKSIQDKIDYFNKKRDEYVKKMQEQVEKLQNMVLEQVKRLEDLAINEISKVIKLGVDTITGALSI